jgi:hypothetical protein
MYRLVDALATAWDVGLRAAIAFAGGRHPGLAPRLIAGLVIIITILFPYAVFPAVLVCWFASLNRRARRA